MASFCKIELADIFRKYGSSYRKKYALPLVQLKTMRAIEICRTNKLGGHLKQCNSCGHEHPVYNSCGNRHCPKCQTLAKVRWLQARKKELLPVPYFHAVFTLPHQLNPLARSNKKIMYDILFQSVSQTLLEFGRNLQNGAGGEIGFISILHTWDQKLNEHVHLHCIIPAGALSTDKQEWFSNKSPDFLFPVKALSKVFRGKFIDKLKKVHADKHLIFPGQSAKFETKNGLCVLINQLWEKPWVVYSKRSFASAEHVFDYLGRYTHRIAISNNRIKKIENDCITFSYRNRKKNKCKDMSLNAEEFIRRFLLHVLPKSYIRIRYFGFLSNRYRKKNIIRCRQLFKLPTELPVDKEQSTAELMQTLTGINVTKCPYCKKGELVTIRQLTKSLYFQTKPKVFDTS